MQQPTIEERLSALEDEVAELKQARHNQDTINGALLARIDSFIGDLHRVERDQRRGFDELRAGQKNLEARMDRFEGRMDRIEEGQQALQAGVDQIVAILTGKAKTND